MPSVLSRRLTGARAFSRPAIGSANLDWRTLGFGPRPTAAVVKYEYERGAWDAGTESAQPTVELHLFSHVLNFGQSIFEGLKAFHTADGRVCLFNPACNAARLRSGAARLMLPSVPDALFFEGLERTVRANAAYLPPYGSGGALYIRPVLFGHGPLMAIAPAPRFTLAFISTPVGAFFDGALRGKRALVRDDFDRAAPRGTGGFKVAGNYAPDMLVSQGTHERGFDVSLFLDAKTQTMIEEFSVANFVAVAADGSIVSPSSPSVLPSCTRSVVLRLARELGLRAHEREIAWAEVSSLKEVAACGTAVVLTPMSSITRGEQVVEFASHPTVQRLYDAVVQTQTGERPDSLGLLHEVTL
ncbi:hypothetical protein KFE25_012592 [Diacronema lutheri]|uniref:Branched-chain-amino-acid transaminase n=1 Tax=Diacronema lutheri TaxID=2081491 RepID=A0A8J5XRG0_DIALT|nr:hypothetical protein KFE25_012592 [Diacronema lutheri]